MGKSTLEQIQLKHYNFVNGKLARLFKLKVKLLCCYVHFYVKYIYNNTKKHAVTYIGSQIFLYFPKNIFCRTQANKKVVENKEKSIPAKL
jgi:hypothetical protein